MKIYIASPYSIGDPLENVRRQIDACEELSNLGHLPIWPLSSHYWHEIYQHDWQFWMKMDMQLLALCDAVLRLNGESVGADCEVDEANRLGITVYYNINDIKESKIN